MQVMQNQSLGQEDPLEQEMVKVKVSQSCPTLCDPMDYPVHGILQARILEWVAFPFSRGCYQPRDPTQVSSILADSLLAEPQGKPKYTGVGSLSLPQGIIPTQELKWGLLNCRWILYYLIQQGKFGIINNILILVAYNTK